MAKAEGVKAEAVEAVAEEAAVVKAMAAMAAARPACASGQGVGVGACVRGRAGGWVGAHMRACMEAHLRRESSFVSCSGRVGR